MAQISITWTVADDKVDGIKDDFATHHGFVAGQGETQNAFIKRIVGDFIKNSVKNFRVQEASSTAMVSAETDVVLS